MTWTIVVSGLSVFVMVFVMVYVWLNRDCLDTRGITQAEAIREALEAPALVIVLAVAYILFELVGKPVDAYGLCEVIIGAFTAIVVLLEYDLLYQHTYNRKRRIKYAIIAHE